MRIDMHRLTSFLEKYRPQADPGVLRYLEEACVVLKYSRGAVIKTPDDPLPYFCIVLEGLVGGYESNNGSDPLLRELILPMDYFSGTAHAFSLKNHPGEYIALTHVSLLRMSVHHARHGQQHYPDLSELFQVMKQRKINLLRTQIVLYQETNHFKRYQLYRKLLPDWSFTLPHSVQYQFLRIGRASYFSVKRRYFLR